MWYLVDRLSTARDFVDSSGTTVNHTEYRSFGVIVSHSDFRVADRFAATGREIEPLTNVYYYRARYFDPSVGRFLSNDPIAFAASDSNLFRYVNNSPINGLDPSGLIEIPSYSQISAQINTVLEVAAYHTARLIVVPALPTGQISQLALRLIGIQLEKKDH